MPYTILLRIRNLYLLAILCSVGIANAQTTQVGSGSYTNTYPGADEAGRNGFPSGTPQISGNALNKPVPTNDWWSKVVKENHADNLFNYPMTLKTINSGLIVTYIPWGVIGDSAPIEVGLSGLNATKTTVADYTDWTVTLNWNDGSHDMKVTSGIGMPFLYFEKESDDELQIKVKGGTASVSGELLIIENASGGADFVFYAPTGSTWTNSGNTYASTLNGKNYWSMAMLPQSTSNVSTTATAYKKYAYVFPTNTTASWAYDETTSVMKTDFKIDVEIKEGTGTNILQGLLPHQWAHLAAGSPVPAETSYEGVRGEIKMLDGNSFSVTNTFKGILPTMPYLANYSEGFSPSALASKISQIENDGLATWTDSYNEGQVMNRLIQTARIADQTGNFIARDKMVATIKERLEDWLTYEAGEVAFLFYYNTSWSALLGYPAGHGQDNNINDHHFHWGYFIHAAAFMEQFEPGWMDNWGEMINHLVRDAASDNRTDSKFPYLRNFSPYAGHCWANGFASFPQGNDQESTSESMQFNSSLIHWGTITGNDQIRDLGIYLYTTEQTAIEEYWLDIHERNFKDNQQYSLVSRVWGNSYDNGTFWTADITASYGIELYPMHGGSLYLGHHTDYVKKLWAEIETNTAILSAGDTNPNLWHDVFWQFLSLVDPAKAIELYDAYPDRILKFGVTDVQTYHWLHAMNALGEVESTITSDYPIASVFIKNGVKTYVAHNYSKTALTVKYSDGYELSVPAGKMATSRDASVTGTITSDFSQAYTNGSVNLTVNPSGDGLTKVEFFDGSTSLGSLTAAPYTMKAADLTIGVHGLYAKVYAGEEFNVTNIVQVQVGEQVPYSGSPISLPGVIEAGHYDKFEGGPGQGITYVDVSANNEGEFRPEEMVDATLVNNEGATIGWISAGEWVEYTVSVENSGLYKMDFRYASGNASGGGPFHLEINGERLSADIKMTSTSSTNWSTWATNSVADIPLQKGIHVLRLTFTNGEFNLGKMTFSRTGDLSYTPPFADAGANVVVVLPAVKANLDASASTVASDKTLTYAWSQIYGPTAITFSDPASATPEASNLEEGIYKCLLVVSDGTYSSRDEVIIIVSPTANTAPTVSITAPAQNKTFTQGDVIKIDAIANDLDGSIAKVEFFDGSGKLGEATSQPFSYSWSNATIGEHAITAKATDDGGAVATSAAVNIKVDELKECSQTFSDAQQGTFSTGYVSTFSTVGTTVTIKFELLDTDKQGVVAYLWKESPFGEVQMDHVQGNVFSKSVSGFTVGERISYACKFAFAGGLAVTKYVSYVVGSSCATSLGTDASLSDLKVDGTTIDGFAPDKVNYSMELAEGTQTIPTVTAFTKDPKAKATIVAASALPGSTSIQIISEDGKTSATYTIDFTVAEEVTLRSVSMGLKVFSDGSIMIIQHSDANFRGSIEVFNLSGNRLIRERIRQLDNQFLLSERGVLLFRVYDDQGIVLAGRVLVD